MKSKRTIAILLAVGMLLGLLPAAAFAEETVPAVVEGLAVCETCGEDPCVCEEETSSEPGTEETEAPEEELSLEPEIPETEEPEAPGIETEKPEEEPMTVLTLREEEPVVTGYSGEELPEGPDMNGAVVNVTPENAQYTLDGAYGTIDGKTVHFTAGNYDALELGRTTKYAGSGTKYYKGGNTNNEEIGIDNVAGTGTRTYVRTMSNVTFTADSGAALGGFYGGTGHHYGDSYDYVRDTPTVNTNTSYYVWWTMENITFDGLTIEGKFDFACSGTQTDVDGITFQDCKFTGTGTASTVGAAIRMQTDLADCYRNITVDGCEFTNYFQGLFTQGLENVTVRDCNFTTMGHNAIALQNGASNTVRGTVEISGNTFTDGKDRAIRFGNIGENAEITVSRNTAVDFADDDGEVMKAGTVDSSASITIEENNDWNGGHVHDALLPVAKIGNKSYSTLQTAVSAARDGDVVTVLKNIDEDVTLPLRSITLTSQGESKPVLSGKMDFAAGEMPEGAQVTIENLAFENTRIMLVTWGKTAGLDKMGGLTIRDNTFTGTPSGTDTIYAVHINNADNALNNLTVTGNVFTNCGTGSGGAVYATVCGKLVVTGNEFRNSSMNALTLTGKDSGGQVATSAVISENVFENWAAKPEDRPDGRAMRLSGFECDMDLTENSFVSGNLPEEYIKLTGLAEGKRADVNQCYWGGGAPEEGKLLGLGPVVSYYTTEAMEKSLTLTPAAVSVQVGSTAALTAASGTMGGTVVWSTDKAAVATVSEKGVVTGVGAGSATITASLGAVTASCTVTVTPAGSGGSTGGGSSRPSRPVEEELEEPEVPLVPALPFADVAEGDWFLEAVRFVYQRDMMKGTNEEGTLFDPQTATTRGMIVTILHRLEGEPEADGAAFSDVTEGEWYSGAVNWAAENGVVKGYEDGTFRPEGIITREETAVILSRYAAFKGYDKTAKGNMEYYNDKTLVSDWAQEDMVWAVGAKLLSGKENGLLDPQGATSRAEAAQMLKNFCEGFEKK